MENCWLDDWLIGLREEKIMKVRILIKHFAYYINAVNSWRTSGDEEVLGLGLGEMEKGGKTRKEGMIFLALDSWVMMGLLWYWAPIFLMKEVAWPEDVYLSSFVILPFLKKNMA